MKYEGYSNIEADKELSIFEFDSIGKQGRITKKVAFIPTELKNIYNLEFGDKDENDKTDYFSITNNGDRNKILATVVGIINIYTQKYPQRWICFWGSTKERTRLYRMAIGLNFDELSQRFDIYAFDQGMYIPFRKNMKINIFLIKRKNP